MFDRYSMLLRQAVFVARMEAGRSGAPAICSEHLLIGIVSLHPELFQQLGIEITPDQIRTGSQQWHTPSKPAPDSQDIPVTAELGAVFERATSNADLYGCREVRTEHLVLSMLQELGHAAELVANCGATKEELLALMADVDWTLPQLGTDLRTAVLRPALDL